MFASALTSLLVPVALIAATPLDAVAQDPPIRVSLNRDGHYVRGENARVEVRADRDGYLIVLHADPDGRVRVLLPIDPGDDNFVRAGKTYELRGRGDRDAIYIEHSHGTGLVFAAHSVDPFRISDFVVGDHWDYRSLRVSDVASDAELELTQIVERMGSSAGFDYDVAYYEILEPVAYAYPSAFYPSHSYWDPYYRCYYCGSRYHGPGLRIHIGFGGAYYYPWYYDPWYYGPSVYFGDYPYYYGFPYYGYRYYGYRYPYYYGYRYTYYRPYTRYYHNPYRFKDGYPSDRFRDRRAVRPRDRSRRVTTNLVDYRRRGVGLLSDPGAAVTRTRDARVRRVAPNDRRSQVRRATGNEGRRVAPQRTRPTKAEPRRATPQRTTPRKAEPRRTTPRRATPQRSTPRRAEPRRATPQRSAPGRAEPRRSTPSRATPRRSTSSGRRVTQAERRTSQWWKTTDRASQGRRVVTNRRRAATAPSRSASRPRVDAPRRASRSSPNRTASRPSASRGRVSAPSLASRPTPSRSASRPSVSRRAPSVSRAPSRGSYSRGSVSRGGSSRGGSSARSGGYRRR